MERISIRKIKQDLLRHEGLRLKPYLCTAGKLTLGVGRNLEDRGISEEEAEFLLTNDIESIITDLTSHLAWFEGLPAEAKEVLVNMVFNLGIAGVLGFVKTLNALKVSDWKSASDEMLDSAWAKQTGPRAEELAARIREIDQQNKASLEILTEIKEQISLIEKRMG